MQKKILLFIIRNILYYVSNFNIKLIKFIEDKFFIIECSYMKLRLKVNTIFNNHFMKILSINEIEKQYMSICLIDTNGRGQETVGKGKICKIALGLKISINLNIV